MRPELPSIEFAFPGLLRDRILVAIRAGEKTGTSSLLREHEVTGESLPAVAARGRVIDSAGKPVLTIETTDVRVVAFCDVPVEHAIAEGEGYDSVDASAHAHLQFWRSAEMLSVLGEDFVLDETTPVVLERFVVVRDAE